MEAAKYALDRARIVGLHFCSKYNNLVRLGEFCKRCPNSSLYKPKV